ncbi:MAG: LysR substrate-binding domain-containing protein [Hydrogenophaga sp.]|jgi:DNA-binding transcriptional LysR family regulator|uniref:LysR substrate-binding domain-containing protein n=1 Tax=Hydrogenophaga sp. TaxID=1904254 RepID=UPI00260C502E|nr:LysR substrate-binding domain-containing protein [Hydrogenophaga sp.]MDD3785632.1 LysR substrate-binding domain-containing protein [Hydrogenophaga sp.]MDX9968987.1 LysR substrate-binding domain-containing protein [Hydrogenophaga sp.]
MDLRDMRHFLAVAEEGHIGRAAARLHLSQPPLTRHIQALEEKIGAPLFLRTPKGVTLTEAGRTLLEEVPNLLALAQRAAERARLAGQGLIGQLDVGLFGSGVLDVIPRMLARFHEARPEVKIVLHNLTKDAQLQALRERRISIGFNRLVPREAGITTEAVMREPLMVAIPAAHPLAVRPSLSLPDLADVPLILYPNVPMRGLAQEVTDAFRTEGVPFEVEQEVEDAVTALALVSVGFGAAITTQSASNLRLPGVVFRPLHSRRLRDLELSCLYRSGDTSPVLRAFLDVVHEFARDHQR